MSGVYVSFLGPKIRLGCLCFPPFEATVRFMLHSIRSAFEALTSTAVDVMSTKDVELTFVVIVGPIFCVHVLICCPIDNFGRTVPVLHWTLRGAKRIGWTDVFV